MECWGPESELEKAESRRMVQIDDKLRELIVSRIVSLAQPEKIILFGSRTRGTARPDSDIDLLVIARSKQPRYRRAAPIYGVLSDILAPMDILVYDPQEVEEWSTVPQAFVTTAVRQGTVLYEK
jgi:predicted nucleotidyltransferase